MKTVITEPAHSNQNRRLELSDLLREEVEETLGKKITTSGDCIQLGEDIFRKTSFRINPNTLRRFFKLVKTDYQPSWDTLHILCRYCGFENEEELITARKNGAVPTSFSDKEFLNYLISLFKFTSVKDSNDETFRALVKQTIRFLQRYPQLTTRFQRAIAKTKNGQDFYFEQFVDIDGLNSLYGQGLHFYLAEKASARAQVFGHSLLCLKGFLTNNAVLVKKHYEEVMKHKLHGSAHPFVLAQYFATQLYHAIFYEKNAEPILIAARRLHAELRQGKENRYSTPWFEYMFSAALWLAGHDEEALYYIGYGLSSFHYAPDIEGWLHQSLQLIRAGAMVRLGKLAEARKIYLALQPSRFYFLSRKTDTILYLNLKKEVKGLMETDQKHLEQLIAETGFVRMKWMYTEDKKEQ